MWRIKVPADVKVNICGLLRDLFWTVFIDAIAASSFVCARTCMSVWVHVFEQQLTELLSNIHKIRVTGFCFSWMCHGSRKDPSATQLNDKNSALLFITSRQLVELLLSFFRLIAVAGRRQAVFQKP